MQNVVRTVGVGSVGLVPCGGACGGCLDDAGAVGEGGCGGEAEQVVVGVCQVHAVCWTPAGMGHGWLAMVTATGREERLLGCGGAL